MRNKKEKSKPQDFLLYPKHFDYSPEPIFECIHWAGKQDWLHGTKNIYKLKKCTWLPRRMFKIAIYPENIVVSNHSYLNEK